MRARRKAEDDLEKKTEKNEKSRGKKKEEVKCWDTKGVQFSVKSEDTRDSKGLKA